LVHFVFIIRLKHLFTNICTLLVIWLVVFQVSQACSNTDFTFLLNSRILALFDILAVDAGEYQIHTTANLPSGQRPLAPIE